VTNGKYLVERRLGGGGMAEVFLARTVGAEGFSRPVAIKRVLSGYSDRPQFAQMFVSEAQLTSRLQHSNIVSVFDFDRDPEGRLFLVMELVDGVDLDGLLATGPLSFSLVIYLAIEILRGLDHAHELPISTDGMRGVVHRDISPHNVLLAWEGAVKVSDFGIAKARAASSATASQIIKGKPAYMSPEQARGWPIDGRSDLFSVGVMLFEMLCLQPLFAGATMEETFSRLFFQPIPAPHDLRPEVPVDLSRVVASLLVRERDQRTPSARAALAALLGCNDCPKDGRDELIATLSQRFAGRAPIRAREVSRLSDTDPTLAAGALPPRAGTRTAPSGLRPGRKRDRRWVGAALAGLLVLGGAAGVLVASTRAPKPLATAKPTPGEARSIAPAGPAPTNRPPAIAPPPNTTPGVTQPRPPPATSSRADATELGAPTGPGAAPGTDRSPSSHAPARRTPSATPSAGEIREVQLDK
jgi:serine/threonine protein kinase